MSTMPRGRTATHLVHRVDAHGIHRQPDELVVEEPLEVRLDEHLVATTMRTPGHDFELAAGFLFAEGVVGVQEHLRTVAYCTDTSLTPEQEYNVVTVDLAGPPLRHPSTRYAGLAGASSACGVCGAESIDDVLSLRNSALADREPTPSAAVDREVVHQLPARLREAQRVFDSTGGLHAAGLFTADGEPLVVREDIGRHNAVDKVVGARILGGQEPGTPVMCVSGRIGFEIVQKAVAAGVGLVAAIGAPSSLAVRLAEEAGLGLVGFLRRDRCVVYAGSERVGV
jgi:FdhD protein